MSLTIIETTNSANPDSPEARDMIFDALMEHAGKQKFHQTRILLLSEGDHGAVITDMKLDFENQTLHAETVRSKRDSDKDTSVATDTLYHRINAMVDQEMTDIREGNFNPENQLPLNYGFGDNNGK